ncbi:hypothetical protein AB1Y20_008764 [Prymnesium parvum]|uniref:Prefoldin subunit 4 n=1 Tax=Prymnesium parvum TaxID=97485 RepID=A0AB34IU63_PRYPA
MAEPSYVQLELDDKDKESLQELQQSVSQAEKELSIVASRLRQREIEGKRAALTQIELDSVPDDANAYVQVGKMFLYQPLPEIKAKLATTVDEVTKECEVMKEKHAHVKEAHQKCQLEFNEFVKAHLAPESTTSAK